jgi:hypothetical protein
MELADARSTIKGEAIKRIMARDGIAATPAEKIVELVSSAATHEPATHTTTLNWGPWRKPLTHDDRQMLARLVERATSLGYAVVRGETETTITLAAVRTEPRRAPFTRVREIVPGVLATLVGEASATHEEH